MVVVMLVDQAIDVAGTLDLRNGHTAFDGGFLRRLGCILHGDRSLCCSRRFGNA